MYRFLVIILSLFGSLTNAQSPNNTLLSVVVLYRHGDRAPIETYKYDVYDESYWHYGFGQLTDIGKKQQYALGQYLRSRYRDFLPTEYNVSDIKVISSNVDRCLMSASINLAGLYPPEGDQIWNKKLLWQPVPIHTRPESEDPVLAQEKHCPKYDRLYQELMQGKEFQSILDSHRDLFQYLSENSGDNITTLEQLLYLYDTVSIEDLYNLSLPLWTKQLQTGEVKDLTGFAWTTYAYTTDLARLRSGPLIDLIVGHFENISSSVPDTPKFLMLSAHDSTIAPLLTALKLFTYEWPQYTATLLFELRQGEELYVNMIYKNPTIPKLLTLNNCSVDCEFESFKEIIAPLRLHLDEWEEECQQG